MRLTSAAQFEDFKAALLKLAKGRFEPITSAQIQLLARQAGLEPEGALGLQDEAARAVARGKGYLSRDLLDDAIHDLTFGALLKPDDLDALHHLALAHQRRWSTDSKRREDQKEAARLARHCLSLDPAHEASFDLLKRLEDVHAPQLPAATGNKSAAVAVGVLVLLLVVGGGCLAGLLVARVPASGGKGAPTRAIPVALPEVEAPKSDLGSIAKPAGGAIPMAIKETKASEGLEFDVRQSELSVYADSAFFRCAGLVRNRRAGLIRQSSLKLSLLGEDGEVLEVQIIKAPESHEPALRPGDVSAFDTLIKSSPEVRSAQIEVQHVEEEAVEGSFAPSRPMALGWESKRPEGLEISLRERSLADTVGAFDKESFYHDAVLEFEHVAGPAVSLLKIQVRYLDKSGGVLGTNETYVLSTSGPEMGQGEVRLARSIKSVSAKTAAYDVSVIEVR